MLMTYGNDKSWKNVGAFRESINSMDYDYKILSTLGKLCNFFSY